MIHISDYLNAISTGIIPGDFDDERENYIFPEVESLSSAGKKLTWIICVYLERDGQKIKIVDDMLDSSTVLLEGVEAAIVVKSYQEDGKIRDTVPTYISSGKNCGKKNATNVLTQALRNALSIYNKQTKKTLKGASKTTVECYPPMLIKKEGDAKGTILLESDFEKGLTLQKKYNGVRVVGYVNNGVAVLYSRSCNEYLGLKHIKNTLETIIFPEITKEFLAEAREVSEEDITDKEIEAYKKSNVYLDGEVYCHGIPLNKISGMTRREGADDAVLNYNVFDCFFPHAKSIGFDMPSSERQYYVDELFKNIVSPKFNRVKNYEIETMEEINDYVKKFLIEEYEGGIVRKNWCGYCYSYNNYHTSDVLKIKPIFDSEFTVIGYKDGKGKMKNVVTWICEVSEEESFETDDRTFAADQKNISLDERRKIFICLDEKIDGVSRFERDFVGKKMTIEYRERSSKTNKPLQPKSLGFRLSETGEDGEDPIQKLLRECVT
jgi:ATP-dependent DNA ligase